MSQKKGFERKGGREEGDEKGRRENKEVGEEDEGGGER